MKLYVGSRDYCPEGFKTVDIDERYNPDYVANIIDMKIFEDSSCSEVVANAVLEHLEWPDSFKALSEFSRIIRIGGELSVSVPDMDVICQSIINNANSWYSTALLFGVGGRTNKFEAHRFGYTKSMMIEMLQSLGFDEFKNFNSNFDDSSNGWMFGIGDEKIAVSLNIKCKKIREAYVDTNKLYNALVADPMGNFRSILVRCIKPENFVENDINNFTVQSLAFQLIDANQRIKYLENEIYEKNNMLDQLTKNASKFFKKK